MLVCRYSKEFHRRCVHLMPDYVCRALYFHYLSGHGGQYMRHWKTLYGGMQEGTEGRHRLTKRMHKHDTNGGAGGTTLGPEQEDGRKHVTYYHIAKSPTRMVLEKLVRYCVYRFLPYATELLANCGEYKKAIASSRGSYHDVLPPKLQGGDVAKLVDTCTNLDSSRLAVTNAAMGGGDYNRRRAPSDKVSLEEALMEMAETRSQPSDEGLEGFTSCTDHMYEQMMADAHGHVQADLGRADTDDKGTDDVDGEAALAEAACLVEGLAEDLVTVDGVDVGSASDAVAGDQVHDVAGVVAEQDTQDSNNVGMVTSVPPSVATVLDQLYWEPQVERFCLVHALNMLVGFPALSHEDLLSYVTHKAHHDDKFQNWKGTFCSQLDHTGLRGFFMLPHLQQYLQDEKIRLKQAVQRRRQSHLVQVGRICSGSDERAVKKGMANHERVMIIWGAAEAPKQAPWHGVAHAAVLVHHRPSGFVVVLDSMLPTKWVALGHGGMAWGSLAGTLYVLEAGAAPSLNGVCVDLVCDDVQPPSTQGIVQRQQRQQDDVVRPSAGSGRRRPRSAIFDHGVDDVEQPAPQGRRQRQRLN